MNNLGGVNASGITVRDTLPTGVVVNSIDADQPLHLLDLRGAQPGTCSAPAAPSTPGQNAIDHHCTCHRRRRPDR